MYADKSGAYIVPEGVRCLKTFGVNTGVVGTAFATTAALFPPVVFTGDGFLFGSDGVVLGGIGLKLQSGPLEPPYASYS